ncbi:MAG: ribokinase [Bacteroidales bacterium]|nr:ribokinase [Bacteroidales bacterium]
MKITVIGSANMDMTIRTPRIPGASETVVGTRYGMSIGGRGINQSVAAARAGGTVSFVSRVGNDMFGENIVNGLKADHIDVSHVIRDPHNYTGIANIVVTDKGENSVALAPGANMNISEEDVNEAKELILSSDILLMQLEIPVETVKHAARLAKQNKKKIILNPSPALPVSDDLLQSISVLTPDAAEAELLTGINITDERSAELAGRILLERGLDRVIITMRTKGAMVIDNGGAEHVPAFKHKTIDASAVNDVFNGVLAVGLAEGKNFYEAVLFANAACALSLSRPGGFSSIPVRDEIMEIMKRKKTSH